MINDKSIRGWLDNEARGFIIYGINNNIIDVDSLPLISTSKPHLIDALITEFNKISQNFYNSKFTKHQLQLLHQNKDLKKVLKWFDQFS